MCKVTPAGQIHLFMLRIWLEPLGEGHAEIRGEVRHLLSGRRRRVRDWATLAAFMEECINARDPSTSDPRGDENAARTPHTRRTK